MTPQPPPDSLGTDLLRAIARLNRWANRHADFDIPPAQARLLGLMEELGPARVCALADADHSSQPTMSAQLKRLEADGLVSRVPDPHDGRASLVSLSDRGRTVLQDVRRARLAAVTPLLRELPEPARDRLAAGVGAMNEILALAADHHDAHREDPTT